MAAPDKFIKLFDKDLTLHRVMFFAMLTLPLLQWYIREEFVDSQVCPAADYMMCIYAITCLLGTYVLDFFRKRSYQLLLVGIYIYMNSLLWVDYLNGFVRIVNGSYIITLIVCAIVLKEERVLRYYFIYFTSLFVVLFALTPHPPLIALAIQLVISSTVYFLMSSRQGYLEEIQKSREMAEAQSKALQDVLDSLSAMIVFKDKNNRITLVNQAFADFTGKSKEDFVNIHLSDLVKPELLDQYYQEDLEIMTSGKPKYNIVEKIELPDGKTERWVRSDKRPLLDADGTARGVVIYSVDITPQIDAEKQLRESEKRFRLLFEKAPVGMVYTDANLRILRVNEAFCKTVGYPAEYLLTIGMDDLATGSNIEKPSLFFNKNIEQSSNTYQIERRFVSGTGEVVFVESHVLILEGESGQPHHSMGVILDITERKNWERQLLDYASKLEETNRELEEFAYAASHDLREPLRTITSYVQLLERRLGKHLDAETIEFMGYVVKGAQRMNKLILALLEYSRASRTDEAMQWVDLNENVQEVLEDLRYLTEETSARIDVAPLPRVMAMDMQIRILFQNLISNALKYKGAEAPLIAISNTVADGFCTICVKDNGIGIPAEHFEGIFVLFRRLHGQEEYEGVGIGLALCKKIVMAHGGRIWVESTPGKGSSFYFTIPHSENTSYTQPFLK